MTVNTIVTPSSQIDSILPGFINETYSEFVNFMTKADESEERIGFSQNLLQNLQRYLSPPSTTVTFLMDVPKKSSVEDCSCKSITTLARSPDLLYRPRAGGI